MTISQWKVLSVDDDPNMHKDLERVLSSRMGDHSFIFTTATSFDEGISYIRSNRFDLIFLDVHEECGDPDPADQPMKEDQRGEELLKILKSERFVPVIFYTGFPAKVEHLKSTVVKVVAKGEDIKAVRNSVNEILSTKLLHLSRHIEEQSRKYIWDSLEDFLTNPKSNINPSDFALLLARNLARNLSQQAIKALLDLDPEIINPLEMYQFPPAAKMCNPADIYQKKDNGTLWIVLTPACDFEQDKVENVLLAKITPIKEHFLYKMWEESVTKFNGLSPDLQERKISKTSVNVAMDGVRRLVKGRQGERYKFLPGTFFLPDCVIDFQDLTNCPRDHAETYEVICSLDNPYREEILHLFSKYYGRIGTPDYNFDIIWNKIDTDFKNSNSR